MLEQSSFLMSTSHPLMVSTIILGTPRYSYFPYSFASSSGGFMKMSAISDRSRVITDLSGSSYCILQDASDPYSVLPIENDLFMSLSTSLVWNSKNERVQWAPVRWKRVCTFLPVFARMSLSNSWLRVLPPQGTILAVLLSTNPSWTTVTLVLLSPESTTKAVERPVAKHDNTGVLRKNMLETPSFQNAMLAMVSRWARSSPWLKLMSSLKSREQSFRLTLSQSVSRNSTNCEQLGSWIWGASPSGFGLKILSIYRSVLSRLRYFLPARIFLSDSSMAAGEATKEGATTLGASSPPQPILLWKVPMSSTRVVRSWNML